MYLGESRFPADRYDEVMGKLQEAGAGAPAGRKLHVALESDGKINVFDVWDSQEDFEAFGETLLPVLGAAGVDPGRPMVAQVRNIIEG